MLLAFHFRIAQPAAISRQIGTFRIRCDYPVAENPEEDRMNDLIYLVGLIVVIMAILSFFGLR